MSDNVLFVMLLAVLGLALLLRSVIRDVAPTSKIGYASTSTAIAGVASVVLGGLLLKFFPGSGMDLLGAIFMIGGLLAISIGLVVSLGSIAVVLKRTWPRSYVPQETKVTETPNREITEQKNNRSHYPSYWDYLWISGKFNSSSKNVFPNDNNFSE